MAKLKIIIDKRSSNALGQFPIKLQLNHLNTNTTISTGVFVSERHFVGDPLRVVDKSFPNSTHINERIKEVFFSYEDAIQEIEHTRNITQLTAADLRKIIEQPKKEVEIVTFTAETETYIENCRSEKTAVGYKYALALLQRYFGSKEITFEDLSFRNISTFNKWLEVDAGLSMNSRSVVLRNIRAVFNCAIKSDKVSPALYPFRKFEIKSARKEKKHLSRDTMLALIHADLKGEEKKARDFFLLSFYLCGINPIDLYNLHRPDKKGNVSFVRQKIAHTEPLPIHLHVPDAARSIADQYADPDTFLNFCHKHNDYDTFKRRLNTRLSAVGKRIGCENLYFYMARYTWATFADSIGVPHEVISKALGHSDKSTAEKYYIEFNWERVRKANEEVISYLFNDM